MRIHWHVSREGLHVYDAGRLVAVIPFGQFGELLYRLVQEMRGSPWGQ